MADIWFLGSAGDGGVMCMSASPALRAYPWQSSHQGWASWPASSFILDPSYRQRKESATGVRLKSPSSLSPADTPATLAWLLFSWHRKAEAKNLGLKAQIPTVDKNSDRTHKLMKKENGIRNTFLNVNVRRCGTYYKALKAAAASSLTPHTCTELWFLIPGIKKSHTGSCGNK